MWFYIGYTADDGSFQTATVQYVATLADGRQHYTDTNGNDVVVSPDKIVWDYMVMVNQ